MTLACEAAERRLLLLAPSGRDAQLARGVLADAGIRAHACDDLPELVRECAGGVGAILVSEEALADEAALPWMAERFGHQPPWSDLPVLLLAHRGADSAVVRQALRLLGNVTVLERPVRLAALTTAVHTALRARLRQYKARQHLEELHSTAIALRASESRLKALFSNAAVGFAEVMSDGALTLVNEALGRLLQLPAADLVGRHLVDLAVADDSRDIGAALQEVLALRKESATLERRLRRADGGQVWTRITLSLARGGDGQEVHAVAVVEDVTERKEAEHDLREAGRRKDEFLATLAHELRNPLAPIRNSVHIFRVAARDDASLVRVTAMMERQVAHMVRMVDDLLEVSRISRGKIELQRQRIVLEDVVRNAIETCRPQIDAGRHALSLEVRDAQLAVLGDPMRLAQVFANLLNNAAKYTPAGGRIDVSIRHEGQQAVTCVKDNGEGIPRDMLGRVFDMFTQVTTGERAQGGLGIGLTLAHTLVQLHGGSIEAHSEGVNRGCEFTVRLPLVLHEAANAAEHAGGREVGAIAARVLVVDDNADAAEALGMLLGALGAEVQVVHDGPAALARAPDFRPDVVLLDLGMPGMNGLEVARRLRADPALRHVLLVALTGWGQSEDRRRTREAGFDHHLVKPADLDALQSLLASRDGPLPTQSDPGTLPLPGA